MAEESSTPQQMQKEKDKTSKWDEARCLKAARRFSSEAEWQVGSPSSYKAAAAKGWLNSCKAAMTPGVKAKKGKSA